MQVSLTLMYGDVPITTAYCTAPVPVLQLIEHGESCEEAEEERF